MKIDDQVSFAKRAGTSIGYLRKAMSRQHKMDAKLVISLERESDHAVLCEDVRPDIDWAFIRYQGAKPAADDRSESKAVANA